MNEVFATVYGYARALWRRRWWAVAVAWSVCGLAWVIVLLLPERYEAKASVYVDTRTALRPVLEGIAIQQDFEAQLSLVREALLSRPQLEAVATKTKLYADITDAAGMEALVSALQKQITVVATAAAAGSSNTQQEALYTISYQHPNRDKSVEVVRTLLDNFVEGTLSGNRSGADEAQNFLGSEIRELEKRLADAEARLADFKKHNVGMLPGERGDYFSRLETEMNGLQQSETNLAIALSRREELQRQLAVARQYVPGTSTTSGSGGAGVGSDLSARIQESEARLEEHLLRFTEKHPEVVALRRTIVELKEREAKELAELAQGRPGSGAIRSLNVNPVYQSIQVQLNQVEVELASLRGAVAQHRKEMAGLRTYVDSAPEVEQEFSRLNRDYSVIKAQYETLVGRLEKARVTDNATQSGIVRFEVIEPPRAGMAPVWPKRSLFIAMALFFGIGGGIVAALLPHFLWPTFGDMESLSRLTGLPVLGAVSLLRRPDAAIQVRQQVVFFAAACLGLVVVGVALVVFGNAGARALQSLLV